MVLGQIDAERFSSIGISFHPSCHRQSKNLTQFYLIFFNSFLILLTISLNKQECLDFDF